MIELRKIPHLIKYMGAKREILEYINTAIKDLNVSSEWFCDLFAGTSIVACSFKDTYNICANDIQQYSSVFANTYFLNLKNTVAPDSLEQIYEKTAKLVHEFRRKYPELKFEYSDVNDFCHLKEMEEKQQNLINKEFEIGFNLFTKYYSGTYWSCEQCIWIDSIRAVAEEYKDKPEYYAILSSLIFAMSYASQSTGHFAQYREVTKDNMNDILLYRAKDIWSLFAKKYMELLSCLDADIDKEVRISSLDYVDCLRVIEENTIVYADPPYSAVHYSRFYHVVETLVRYDHPVIKYKGRYRDDRHQSPFDKRSEVRNAFELLFKGVKERNSHLVLSYSDNGMITKEDILAIGSNIFGRGYESEVKTKEYIHSKMGRSDEYQMDVNELLISYRRR